MNHVLLAGAAAVALFAAAAIADAAAAAQPVGLGGASLGMSLSDWKALSPPASAGSGAEPTCRPVTRAGTAAARTLTARPPAEEACAYDARFGHDILPHSIQLDPRYRASGLRYLFVGGRLSEIDFNTSVDAYDDVMAMLTKGFGAPSRTVRDSIRTSMGAFPRVRQMWRTSGGDVSLVDPGSDPVQLSVRFVANVGPST